MEKAAFVGVGDEAGFVPEESGVGDGKGMAKGDELAEEVGVDARGSDELPIDELLIGELPGIGVGEAVGEGVGVGHGFSRDSHSCQVAVSLPPNSFQSAWQRSDQCL